MTSSSASNTEGEARRFLGALRDRFKKFSLELHPEKTRRIRFGRFAKEDGARHEGRRKPETFDFLGFTHFCQVNQQNGKFLVGRITMRKRLAAKLKKVKEELKERMHDPVVEQGRWLASVVRGYYQYHAIPGNYGAIAAFREHVAGLWYRTLQRRSQRTRISRERMRKLTNTWLPKAHVLHPWPEERLAAIIQDRSRMR